MKILQVCYKLPYPPNDGGAYSLYNFALSLLESESVNLKVLAMKQIKNKDDITQIPQAFVTRTNLEYLAIDNRINPIKAFFNLFQSHSYFADRFYSKKFEQKLLATIQAEPFDIIQLEHCYLGVYVERIKKIFSGKIILRAQNIEHQLWDSYLHQTASIWPLKFYLNLMTRRLQKMEHQLLYKIDGIICLSDNDLNHFKSIRQSIIGTTISIGFDQSKLPIAEPKNQQVCIYHLGSMDWLPNQQGVDWFLKHVFPLILERNHSAILRLAGKNMPSGYRKKQSLNIVIDGQVEDAIAYQIDKPILIVPLISGSGIRVKIIEALALGKAIVSTSKGAEGLDCMHGQDIMIADDPVDFAHYVSLCLENKALREDLGRRARQLYEKKYTIKNTGDQAVSFYKLLMGNA